MKLRAVASNTRGGWGNLCFVRKKVARHVMERSKAFYVVLFMHFLDFTLGLGH